MSWFTGGDNDFSDFLNTDAGKQLTNIGAEFLKDQLSQSGLIKTGKAPTGNLTPQQLNAGVRPGELIIQNNNPGAGGVMNSLGFVNSQGQTNWLMVIGASVAAGLIVWLLVGRK